MFDRSDAELMQFIHKNAMVNMKNRVDNYNSDPNKEDRLENNLCKYCEYSKGNGWAGQAFTNIKCKGCEREMTFPTTDTDKYCEDCAKEFNICKHCGQIMD